MMMLHNNAFRLVRLLIFDLDGTLVDSETDLTLSVNAVREQMGFAPLPRATVASYVGQGVTTLMQRALGNQATAADLEKAVELFMSYYRLHMLDNTVPYPGVREALDFLAGWKMAVLTNKPVRFSRDLLAGLGMAAYFTFIYGGNSFAQKKPDPVGVMKLMDDMGCSKEQTMIVGDSDTDVLTARNAGVKVCGVSYGLGSNTLASTPPDAMIGDLRDLVPLLDGRQA